MRFEIIPVDLRHAVRAVFSARAFTPVTIVCLALGIAANTTVFSVFDAIFLRPLPFRDADRLVSIVGRQPETGRRVALSLDDARDLQEAVTGLESLAAHAGRSLTLLDGGDPERIGAQLVTANLFRTLGVAPQRGRDFEDADDHTGAAGVAIIGDALWHRRYHADASAVGRIIRLDNLPHTIVGVMPAGFRFPSTSDLWIPTMSASGVGAPGSRTVSLVGRLAPGATLERANAELAARVLPPQGSRGRRAGLARQFGTPRVGSEERTITAALMGATTVLLLIACVNVANLLLARGAGRRREIAVRSALGASRGRIVRQLCVESLLLASIAGLCALPLAWYGIHWVHGAVPPTDPIGPYYVDWSLDIRTLLYTLAIVVATGVAFGLAPAFDAAGGQILNPLRENAGSATGRVQRRVHDALIVAQVALAFVLLATAALFVRTYAGLRGTELGYDTSRLMTMRVYFTGAAYDAADARFRAVDEIAARLEHAPGVLAATVTDLVPLDDQGGSDAPAAIEGQASDAGREMTVHYAGVAGSWPETFDLRILAGRSFDARELATASPVALVNAKLAATFWPGESPIGKRFRLADEDANPWLSVIGVVPDIRTVKLDESRATPPTAWLPHRFLSTRNYGIVLRTAAQPESVTPAVREAVRAVDPTLALFDVYSMEQVRWLSYWMYVMWGTMFAACGIIAVLTAAVGVYGVTFYTVARRTREIGLRVALGARRTQVVGQMLRQIGVLTGLGLGMGVGGALTITPLVESLLIGVSANDPAALMTVALMLALVALVATWVPAWQATAVDPIVALREE